MCIRDRNRAVQDSIFAFRRENQLPLDDESTASDVDYTALCEQQASTLAATAAKNVELKDTIAALTFENSQWLAILTPTLEEAKSALPEPALELLNQRSLAEQFDWLSRVAGGSSESKEIKGVPPTPKANHSGTVSHQQESALALKL